MATCARTRISKSLGAESKWICLRFKLGEQTQPFSVARRGIDLYSTRLGMMLSILVPGLQPWNALHWRLLPPVTSSRGRSLGGSVFRGRSLGTRASINTPVFPQAFPFPPHVFRLEKHCLPLRKFASIAVQVRINLLIFQPSGESTHLIIRSD